MTRNAWFATTLLSLIGVGSAQSPLTLADVPIDQVATERANRFRRLKIDGPEVSKNIRRLRKEVRWHRTLNDALAAAQRSKKPVLLIQALGDLKGYV